MQSLKSFKFAKLLKLSVAFFLALPVFADITYLVPKKVLILPYRNEIRNVDLGYLQHSIPSSINIELLNTYKYRTFVLRDIKTLLTRKSLDELNQSEIAAMAQKIDCTLVVMGSLKRQGNNILITTRVTDIETGRAQIVISKGKPGLQLFQALGSHGKAVVKMMSKRYPPEIKTVERIVVRKKNLKELLLIANFKAGVLQSNLNDELGPMLGGQFLLRSALVSPLIHPTVAFDWVEAAEADLRFLHSYAGLSLPVYLNQVNYVSLHGMVGYAATSFKQQNSGSLALNLGIMVGIHISDKILTNFGIQAIVIPNFNSALSLEAVLGLGYHFF